MHGDRGAGEASFRTALDYLRRGEAVGIFPEATISRAMELKEFKTGARAYVDIASLVKLGGSRGKEIGQLLTDLGVDGLKSLTFHSGFDGPLSHFHRFEWRPGSVPNRILIARSSPRRADYRPIGAVRASLPRRRLSGQW